MCVGYCPLEDEDSSGGVSTLARIRVTATREKSKGNCIRPGMDVNSIATFRGDNRPGLKESPNIHISIPHQ